MYVMPGDLRYVQEVVAERQLAVRRHQERRDRAIRRQQAAARQPNAPQPRSHFGTTGGGGRSLSNTYHGAWTVI